MDENINDALITLADFCKSFEGICTGCPFYLQVTFLGKTKGFCFLTSQVPENWDK